MDADADSSVAAPVAEVSEAVSRLFCEPQSRGTCRPTSRASCRTCRVRASSPSRWRPTFRRGPCNSFSILWRGTKSKWSTRCKRLVARDHTSPRSIGLIDETACPKKGDQTPGVQRQWCGATGKTDNCVVTVHLGYAVDEFHCLLAASFFARELGAGSRALPASDIPDEIDYRPKWRIALELLDRPGQRGDVSLPGVRRRLWLEARVSAGVAGPGATYVAEVPRTQFVDAWR